MWSRFVLYCIESFIWMVFLEKINLKSKLFGLGIIEFDDVVCCLCEEEIEDVNYFFVYCIVLWRIWLWWFLLWGFSFYVF